MQNKPMFNNSRKSDKKIIYLPFCDFKVNAKPSQYTQ